LFFRQFSDSHDGQDVKKKEEKQNPEKEQKKDEKRLPEQEEPQQPEEETKEERARKLARSGYERFQREYAKLEELVEERKKKTAKFPWGLILLLVFLYLFQRLGRGQEIDWNYFRNNYLLPGRVILSF